MSQPPDPDATFFTGATIKHLTGRSLGGAPVPLPPASEQLRIVDAINMLMTDCDTLEGALRIAMQEQEAFSRAASVLVP